MSGIIQSNTVRASGTIAVAAAGLNWSSTILTALTTFTVTVANAGGNKYFINGVQQQTVNLLEGFTYKFDQSDGSNNGHPLRFSTTSGGSHSGGSEYTTGVTTNGTPGSSGAYTQIVVASGAPVLYYYCTAHSGMGGTANTTAETVEAGNGYWIDTTSTTCTITLPSAAAKGDQIVLIDYARTWGTNKISIDSNGLNYQGNPDSFTLEYTTSGQSINLVYSDSTKGWIPLEDDVTANEPVAPPTQKAIFAFGNKYVPEGDQSLTFGMSNKVNSSGVVIADTAATGGDLTQRGAATYGTDKAIFAFGNDGSNQVNTINLVNNQGIVAANSTGTGSARLSLAATSYGSSGQAIFAYGIESGGSQNKSNKVSNTGAVASDVSGVGTARHELGASPFGGDKGIFAYGYSNVVHSNQNVSNIVSNTGVIATDQSGVGSARGGLAAAQFGDRCIFSYGATSVSNLVSNTGVVASDVTASGTGRIGASAAPYGGDKGLFCLGNAGSSVYIAVSNLVSTSGVIASDTAAVSGVTTRAQSNGAGYSISA